MKLDRNINENGRGKYALLRLRNTELTLDEIRASINKALGGQVLQFGDNDDTEFFVIKLKDKYAPKALKAYAEAAAADGEFEYADEVYELAKKSSENPNRKKPD